MSSDSTSISSNSVIIPFNSFTCNERERYTNSISSFRGLQEDINRIYDEIYRQQAIMGTGLYRIVYEDIPKPPRTKLEQEINDLETMGINALL